MLINKVKKFMKTKNKKPNSAFEQFLEEKDPVVHKKAIEKILADVDLNDDFLMLIERADTAKVFSNMWTQAWKDEKNPTEKKKLKILAESSKKFYKEKDYRKLCEVFYDIIFRYLADFIHLREREDFETITVPDLHSKNLIPPEIFLQYSLIEIIAKSPSFDWDRGDEISNQSLVFFITCFGDILEFFHEEDEESEENPVAFRASATPKIGRNEPCRCGSGIKSKKCCGEIKEEKIKCGLCGNSRNLQKTDCCGNWICNDANEYVVFSYARNSCSRNHDRYTLCGYHKNEGHKDDWKTCKKCLDGFKHELEMYVWYGTNEYNFTKLENPPTFKPTHCGKCGRHLVLPDGGYSVFGDEYRCEECPITDKERNGRISMSKSRK